jgi:hypothetical protein
MGDSRRGKKEKVKPEYLLLLPAAGLLFSALVVLSKTGIVQTVWKGFINALDRLEDDEKPQYRPAEPHKHRWRQVTPYVRQCNDRKCSIVEFSDDPPDGMREYVELMTTRQARENPKREASIYPSLDSKMIADGRDGVKCWECARIFPAMFPWCPYCDPRPIDNEIVQRWFRDH